MNAFLIALAIPVFFLLIGVELWFNRRHGDLHYRFNDSITDMSCGVGSQIHEGFIRLLTLGAYTLVWAQVAVFDIGMSSIAGWILAIVGLDFLYYWFHRASHRVNFLWAGHVVHHQSEEYNLAVALRQSWYGPLFEWVFYLPLAILGVPPLMYISSVAISRLYQFWIHTQAIRRLGTAETVLNTPSHHRVHHGINPRYIDKNYAGIFITWDKLFGTFEPEEEEVVYGTVKPLASWNPFWAQLANWVQMARISRATQSWRDKLRVWFAPPEWRPEDLGGSVSVPEVTPETRPKFETPVSRGLSAYVLVNFGVVGALTATYLLVQESIPKLELLGFGAWIVAAITSWGGLFEGRRWGAYLDAARLLATAPLTAWLLAGYPQATAPLIAAGAFSLGMLIGLWRVAPPRGEPVTHPSQPAPAR